MEKSKKENIFQRNLKTQKKEIEEPKIPHWTWRDLKFNFVQNKKGSRIMR